MVESERSPIEKMVWEKEKRILESLAKGMKIKDIAVEYTINDQAIHRVRKRALTYYIDRQDLLPKDVQEYLVLWASRHNKNISGVKQMERHKEDLYQAARELLRKLDSYLLWDGITLIGKIIVEEENFETIIFFQDDITIGLFEHLKRDINELKPFNKWEELSLKVISIGLRKQISLKAIDRDFNGKCGLCKDWI